MIDVDLTYSIIISYGYWNEILFCLLSLLKYPIMTIDLHLDEMIIACSTMGTSSITLLNSLCL